MRSIPSFSLDIFCLMISTSPRPGSTMNGMVRQTGQSEVSIVKFSGHDYVRM